MGNAAAAAASEAGAEDTDPPAITPHSDGYDYRGESDEALTQLAAGWEDLSGEQRRALLTEMKHRMARRDARPVQIRSQHRFGRVIRRSDGTVVRIETQVVRIRPVPRADGGTEEAAGEQGASERSGPAYGTGFEQRASHKQRSEDTPTPTLVHGSSKER